MHKGSRDILSVFTKGQRAIPEGVSSFQAFQFTTALFSFQYVLLMSPYSSAFSNHVSTAPLFTSDRGAFGSLTATF